MAHIEAQLSSVNGQVIVISLTICPGVALWTAAYGEQ
jgi:hypothetical protein